MSDTVIEIDNLLKKYRLGVMGTGTLRHDLNRWWHRVRGKPDPYTKVDQVQKSKVTSDLRPLTFDPSLADDEIWALKDVSFGVRQGEIVGIIGRNGAGKSTLLKILSRVTAPTSGEVRVKGRIASLLEVGTGFHPELSGRENIFLNGTILGMTRAEIQKKFDEIVAFAEVEKFLDTPVKRYSSGMYVRLAFAVAAHLESEILIVDEVLAVGDIAFQKKCLGRMTEVAQTGRTVLFVSHNMGAIKSLCSRAMLLDAGRVSCDGSVDRVVDVYSALTSAGKREAGLIPEDAPRPWSTSEARLRSVHLMDTSGTEITQTYFAQPFRVKIVFDVFTNILDAVIEVGIATIEGTRVTFSSNIDGGKPPAYFPQGRHSVAVDINVILLPRQYIIELAIHHRDGITIDWVERTMDFTVLNVAETGSDYYPWSQVRGFVRPAACWHGLESADVSPAASIAGD